MAGVADRRVCCGDTLGRKGLVMEMAMARGAVAMRWSVVMVLAAGSAGLLTGCGGDADDAVVTLAPTTASASAGTGAPSAEPSAAATSVSPSATAEPVAAQGFPEGERYWTFQDSPGSTVSFGAYSKRSGSSMCLIKIYPEYVVETGTVAETAGGQQFSVNERAETMINPYVPAYVATVVGDPDVAVTMTWPDGTLVLNASDMAGAAAAIAASNPGTDGMEALTRITPACP